MQASKFNVQQCTLSVTIYNCTSLNNLVRLIISHRITHAIRVNLPAHSVWEVLQDFSSIEKTSHSVERSPILEGKRSGVGTKRKCYFYDGTTVVEEIIEFQEGQCFKMVLSEYSMPLKSIGAEMKVEEVDQKACNIRMSMDFVVKGGLFGKIMGSLILRHVLKAKVLKKELIGLAFYAATGKPVGKKMPSVQDLEPVLS